MTNQMETYVRTQRSRTVLLGREERIANLAHGLGNRAVCVNNAFEAIGEVTAAPAREPIEAVLMAESALGSMSEHPARAMRRIDPSVRIFLVRDAPPDRSSPRTAVDHQFDEGFDAVLHDWPSAEELSRLVGSGALPEDDVVDVVVETSKRPSVQTSKDNENAHGPKAQTGASSAGRSDVSGPSVPQPPSTHHSQELGDIDLVEAVLDPEMTVRDRAIDLMRQHAQWPDAALVDDVATDDDAPSGGARVSLGERTFGRLVSEIAPAEELQHWADWLAKWLALDEDHRLYREWSFRDELTGAWNRRYFMQFLRDSIKFAAKKRLPVTVMIFDLDDFKKYNDEFGHAAGDDILCETVRLLNSVIRKSDRVCRIGGDEFAVVFVDPGGPREKGSMPPETVEQLAQRFQAQVCDMRFPKLGIEAPGTLSVSAGLATFPWDAWEPQALIEHADQLALESKRKGKNAITLGQGARHVCEPGD